MISLLDNWHHSSVPDLGTAVEEDGRPKPGLRKEMDGIDPPSRN